MGFIKDFREYIQIKHGKKLFLTNELYVGKLGTVSVFNSSDRNKIHAQFNLDRYVIMKKASGNEVRKHLIKKYGNYFGVPDMFYKNCDFEKPENCEYYKLVTMNNRLIPCTTPSVILGFDTSIGNYEVVSHARTINALKNKHIRFADIISLDDII